MQPIRAVVLDRHIDEVFDFVADPRREPRWRDRVVAVAQVAGDGPRLGARYEVVRRKNRFARPRTLVCACVEWEPPERVAWRLDDDLVAYELETVWTATRVTLPAALRELRALRQLLERA